MNAAAFLSELRRREIQVWASGDQLHCTAKPGALTPELRDQLRQWKNDILNVLASAQALATQERAIVPLQASGTRTPVFAVPGHNGDVFCYRALAQRLGEDQPFFGLQPPGVDGQDAPLERVEDLATCFAGQIRAFRPEGPYVIAGYCAGGTVAYELAQQLSREGAQVSLVALFGSPYPAYFRPPAQILQRVAEQAARIGSLARDLAVRSPAECRLYLAEGLRRRRERQSAAQAAATDPVLVLRGKVERATLVAVRGYTPRASTVRVAFFLPSAEWHAARRWRSVSARAEEYAGPDGCGSQEMLREPNAGAFAALLEGALRRS
ncbi:MAG TPA: alpha/beta fold hydrolase [Burkholderiales bacterium]|nr:alpha/beta fold hydrolase [Burkholderiales bacterium]